VFCLIRRDEGGGRESDEVVVFVPETWERKHDDDVVGYKYNCGNGLTHELNDMFGWFLSSKFQSQILSQQISLLDRFLQLLILFLSIAFFYY
jgi:hypothetical protein